MEQAKVHELERAKWDALALDHEDLGAPRDASFEAFVRRSGRLPGVLEFLGDLDGRRVLEYGCGVGETTVLLAQTGADVSAFDLSPACVELARRRTAANGVRADLSVAAAEALPYEDASFDVVFGIAILHHLDAAVAGAELRRVLRPGGRAVFTEPLGTNALLAFARDHLPYPQKTPRGTDRPLTYEDLAAWGRGFAVFRYREVQLLSMAERLLGYRRRILPLRRVDEVLLRRVPALRPLCRYVALYFVR